ncbi:MAG: peptidoglycan-binding protein [Alphaproteobacteria bacterium]|nr:peptidoglycan-binding protein [Alphaproteobacteria bacterium]MBU1280597.1 peptidoglycan-binding protein [Alphaproteobacteria bacterium]MBU1574484.1 peptidoglycan-binding protein [Alphaproteobacteria bacterium]MBU1827227.1 peptidoglycan-binding protein [Alphaproteobacteria bacterium]MBU2078837.1 peptidoglycan-binding protein [Alphaproteobacteria bacterium]
MSKHKAFKHFVSAALAAAMMLGTTTRVQADGGDFIAGAVIGGLLGAASQQPKKKTSTAPRTYSRPSLPSTQEGKEIQASLNYFGFNAGSVDGQLGKKTRDAVSAYQVYLGYPITGQLSPFEQELLISSYNRAQAGGYQTTQLVASNPEGTRGLLKMYRSEMASGGAGGATMAIVPGTTPGTTVVVNPVMPAPQAPAAATLPSFAAATPEPTLPSFLGAGTQVSLASHCNTVSLLTNSNGGFVTEASMVDANQALNEQFCLARTYAISQGEDMISKVQGFTPDQIAAQCEGLAPPMAAQVAALSIKPRDAVLAETSTFVLNSGMSPAQLAGTAKICLSVGYRTDNMDVALASSLMLVAVGERAYGELLGHHLSQGVGVTQRPDLAQAWYEDTLTALATGVPAVFAPGQAERAGLLRKASMSLNGGAAIAAPTAVVPASGTALPAFSITE